MNRICEDGCIPRLESFRGYELGRGGRVGWDRSRYVFSTRNAGTFVDDACREADTAVHALYLQLELTLPWKPLSTPEPFLVYGGSTSVGLCMSR